MLLRSRSRLQAVAERATRIERPRFTRPAEGRRWPAQFSIGVVQLAHERPLRLMEVADTPSDRSVVTGGAAMLTTIVDPYIALHRARGFAFQSEWKISSVEPTRFPEFGTTWRSAFFETPPAPGVVRRCRHTPDAQKIFTAKARTASMRSRPY